MQYFFGTTVKFLCEKETLEIVVGWNENYLT